MFWVSLVSSFSVPSRIEKKLHEKQDIFKAAIIKDSFEVKRYSKGLLVQIKEEEMYKILKDKAFTEDTDCP